MSITLTIPDEIAGAAEILAQASGVSAEELLLDALRAYFPPVPEELRAEFDAWELATDQDFARFEGEQLAA